jgi:hypothetical protein
MRTLEAQKIQTQMMLEVNLEELKELKKLNPWISIGQYDIETHMKDKGVIGYIAGDIGTLKLSDEEDKIADNSFHDCWFINKDFFNKNYKEKETDESRSSRVNIEDNTR